MSETNYEHYKEQLLAYTITIGECDFIQEKILKRSCTTEGEPTCEQCRKEILRWLKQPYEEPAIEIDWTKVPVDTPVMIKDDERDSWDKRFFAFYVTVDVKSRFCTWINGNTSQSTEDFISWRFCELAPEVDPTPYYKN